MPSQRVTVDLSFYEVECCTLNGRFILYSEEVVVEQEHSPNPQKNAFAVMMMAAKELKLPPKVFSTPERYKVGRGDHRLHDDIIDFLKGKCLGFSTGTENTTGKQIVKVLTDALYYIQPHLQTLTGRILNFLPSYFSSMLGQV